MFTVVKQVALLSNHRLHFPTMSLPKSQDCSAVGKDIFNGLFFMVCRQSFGQVQFAGFLTWAFLMSVSDLNLNTEKVRL